MPLSTISRSACDGKIPFGLPSTSSVAEYCVIFKVYANLFIGGEKWVLSLVDSLCEFFGVSCTIYALEKLYFKLEVINSLAS